jgi:hypothetical protein
MEAFFWAALGFLVLAAVAGTGVVAVQAWRAWNAFVSLAAAGGAAAEELLERAEHLAGRGEQVARRSDELLTAVARLERSTARGRVLLGAVGEARDLVRAVRSLVPRK